MKKIIAAFMILLFLWLVCYGISFLLPISTVNAFAIIGSVALLGFSINGE